MKRKRRIGTIRFLGTLPKTIRHPHEVYWTYRREIPVVLRRWVIKNVPGVATVDDLIAASDRNILQIGKRVGNEWAIYSRLSSDREIGEAIGTISQEVETNKHKQRCLFREQLRQVDY